MTPDEKTFYRALRARDRRFDGVFFVAVETTGIYCRPICPARPVAEKNCRFFRHAAEAEREGYRACLRCRPELAPGNAPTDSVSRLVRAALERIRQGALDERSVDGLARELGVTGRHLRRAMDRELGVSPVELAQTKRLGLAKQLLQDTSLPVAEVAFASGFSSVRRFNALFGARFGRPPSSLRAKRGRARGGELVLRLDYRPPLGWGDLLAFIGARACPGVEIVTAGDTYARVLRVERAVGVVSARHDEARAAVQLSVSPGLAPHVGHVVARARAAFDLDARPSAIAEHLGRSTALRPLVAHRPGLRVPGCFAAFELAVRAVLGQQVSVRAATTLAGRLAERFGARAPENAFGLTRSFPEPSALVRAGHGGIAEIGLPGARARTIHELARAAQAGRLDALGGADPSALASRLAGVPGIGPWTAEYIAMRALGWPDAFPAGDLAVRRALGASTSREAEALAEPWRPWRAYGVIHLWTAAARGG
jgi:AraC family transcriptional regulator of adaptative response / DNA-3-methyladenine glycosylase II